MEPPTKKARLLADDEDLSDDNSTHSGTSDSDTGSDKEASLKINTEYAKRFEHNEQRAERQRLEEKYSNKFGQDADSDSESESEDDEGELVTEELDAEIHATLNAIRNKDPRVYDQTVAFYKPEPKAEDMAEGRQAKRSEKPIHLRDYHRQILLEDAGEAKPRNESRLPTYAEEQSALKRDFLHQMDQSSDKDDRENDSADNDDDFLVRKPGQPETTMKSARKTLQDLDVTTADQDPENYLSNFMAARAWVPTATSKYQAFESEDESEEERADAFEAAYNMRFEDPERANEKLVSHSREAAAKHSVRREEKSARQRAREHEKSQKDEKKRQREEEKARLRRLKLDEAQEKWVKMQEAAGLKKRHLSDEQLLHFLERGFEGENWDTEMKTLLGEGYSEEEDDGAFDDDNDNDEEDRPATNGSNTDGKKKKKHRLKKPEWDDDIDIADIVPDFDQDEERQRSKITLSDAASDSNSDPASPDPASASTNPARAQANATNRAAARTARRHIESLVSAHPTLSTALDTAADAQGGGGGGGANAGFRYRDTSPTSHGLTPREILMASDAALNDYVGLKKLAAWRDEARKERDRARLGSKGRLRRWRRETFGGAAAGAGAGAEDGGGGGGGGDGNGDAHVRGRGEGEGAGDVAFERFINAARGAVVADSDGDGERKRKRRRERERERGGGGGGGTQGRRDKGKGKHGHGHERKRKRSEAV